MKKFRYSSSPSTARGRGFLLVAACCSWFTGCAPQDNTVPKSINEVHRFELNSCEIRYNNEPLRLGAPIDQWAQILGPYDRMVNLANDIYVWDDVGIILYVTPNQSNVKQLTFIFGTQPDEMPPEVLVEIYDQQLMSGDVPKDSSSYKRIESMKESQVLILQSRPRTFFQKGFSLDGVIIDADINIGTINSARYKLNPESPRFVRRYVPWVYNFEQLCTDKSQRVLHQINTLTTDASKMVEYGMTVEPLKPEGNAKL